MSRYEIREVQVSHPWVDDGDVRTRFDVWDTEKNRVVPFGRYGKRVHAESRVDRMEER